MSTVTKIKEAIDRLAPQEYCELMSVLHPFEDDDWDRQMKADATAVDLALADRTRSAPTTGGRASSPGDTSTRESENLFLIESINNPARMALFLR
ncbi:MAG: hypothetical protein O2957_08795 [Verrucomicrobia bacterium]|nr:hypothetical protein [Verrucomicrobiota bacterium]